MIINETADPAAVDLATRYGIHLSHPTQLRLFSPVRARGTRAGAEPPALRAPRRARREDAGVRAGSPDQGDSEVVAARPRRGGGLAAVDADTRGPHQDAIIEACINAFEHASDRGRSGCGTASLPTGSNSIVQDDGKGFRAGKTPEESKKNAGWGLKLIGSCRRR